ncbi:MAG TPA: amidohydrolase [Burkholderiaceae bacterium]
MPTPNRYAIAIAVAAACGGLAHADTMLVNANGYTLDKHGKLLRFDALAFDDKGKLLAVGKLSTVAAKAGKATQIDVQGKTVLPGLIDAHGHVFDLGMGETQVSLRDTPNLAAAQKIVADYARANPARPWVLGFGWNQAIWQLGRFPTAQELDAVVADRPAWLSRVDGHAGWANTRALQLAGITKDTKDPQGGRIERDANGNPTGVLVDAAMGLIDKVVPPASADESRQALDAALATMAKMGLTGVHDAGVSAGQDALYRSYADSGKLTARIYGMVAGADGEFDKVSANGPLASYGNDHYALQAVKLYSDGALGSRGAALLAPYSDEPSTKGLLFSKDGEMFAKMEKVLKKGYQVNVHAIGDAGNRQIVDAYARLHANPAYKARRNRIEHAQIVTLADIPRFKQYGIVPSMQPTHATSDKNMAEARIGSERIKGAYAWRTFLKQGSKIACGSDFPVESSNPFWGIHAAVTRQDMSNQPAGGWYPQQALSVTEALRCFTLDAAHAAHQEASRGSLEAGKWADFIVVDQDLFKMPAADIHKMRVLQTWVGGRPVHTMK